jgi:hypothetical protein
MILKIFLPKHLAKILAFFAQTTASFCKNCDHNISFWEKRQFFRLKLSKISENCDHNIDPRLGEFLPNEWLIFIFLGQRPLVPLRLLRPQLFPIILFLSTTLLTGMSGISLNMQWPLTSQSHGCFLKENNYFFLHRSNSMRMGDCLLWTECWKLQK